MPQLSIARLFEDNEAKLKLAWIAGEDGGAKELDSELTRDSSRGLIGHLNFIHPNLIQVLGLSEADYLNGLDPEHCGRMLAQVATGDLAWRDAVALQRRWPGDERKTVAEAFAEEQPFLLPLPQNRFDTDLMVPASSSKTIYLRFDRNDYSIPPSAVGKALTLIASPDLVRILLGKDEIARHRRSWDRGRRVEDPAHIEALLAIKRRARGSVASARLLGAVPEAERFLEAAFHKGESVAQHTDKLLRLLDDYGAAELRAAMQEALRNDTPRIGSVAYLLNKHRRASRRPAEIRVEMTRRPDLEQLYITPHDSNTYDQLADPGAHDDDHD